jgi:hypothetical protein
MIVLLLLLANVSAAPVGSPPWAVGHGHSQPLDSWPCWRLVAASDLIVAGQLDADEGSRARLRDDEWDFLRLKLSRIASLKGPDTASIEIRFSPAASRSLPSARAASLLGKGAIAFLVVVDAGDSPGIYFAPGSAADQCEPLMAHDKSNEEAIGHEVARQQEIGDRPPLKVSAAIDARVEALVGGLLQERTQDAAVEELFRLTDDAIPSLVARLADRRPLPSRRMVVPNAPTHFESRSIYTPAVVTDVLATVLESLTGVSFGRIANGGTERDRARNVRGWRLFVHERLGQ